MIEQAHPDYNADMEDLRTALRVANERIAEMEAQINAQRAEIEQYRWRDQYYTSATQSTAFYRHSEVLWLRTRATDSQISAMLKSRDDAVKMRVAADEEIKALRAEIDALTLDLFASRREAALLADAIDQAISNLRAIVALNDDPHIDEICQVTADALGAPLPALRTDCAAGDV